jgi:4-oxalocrotonate tautomerase
MTEVANYDKFQIFALHESDELVYPQRIFGYRLYSRHHLHPGLLGFKPHYGYEEGFFRRISDDLHARAHVRKEDVWIVLIDADRTDWSFGKG